MNGMHADGAKSTGFKSMVVAQFTRLSLQKDDRAFVRYNASTGNYDVATSGDGAHLDGLLNIERIGVIGILLHLMTHLFRRFQCSLLDTIPISQHIEVLICQLPTVTVTLVILH